MFRSLLEDIRQHIREATEAVTGFLGAALVIFAAFVLRQLFGLEIPDKPTNIIAVVMIVGGQFLAWRKLRKKVETYESQGMQDIDPRLRVLNIISEPVHPAPPQPVVPRSNIYFSMSAFARKPGQYLGLQFSAIEEIAASRIEIECASGFGEASGLTGNRALPLEGIRQNICSFRVEGDPIKKGDILFFTLGPGSIELIFKRISIF